jgi:hypothetical protein
MGMRIFQDSILYAGLLLLSSGLALCDVIQPGSPDPMVGLVLPPQVTGAPMGLVFVQEDPETGPVVSLVGSFTRPVSLGDVVLCEGAAKADHTGCASSVTVSDVLRFTKGAVGPNQYQYQLFSDPDTPEGGLDLTTLPGGGLSATTYYIDETSTVVDASPFGGPTAFPVVVYKADDGSGNVNTYWIASDADAGGGAPEPSSAVLFGAGLAALCILSAFRRMRISSPHSSNWLPTIGPACVR